MAVKPPYAPNVVNQTVSYGGATWKGNPGSDWVLENESGGGINTGSIDDYTRQMTEKRQAFNTAAKGEEQAFVSKFKTEYPQVLTGIEEELGLPTLRETAFTQAGNLNELPAAIEQAARGRDISAGQLERIQSAKTAERLPDVNELLSNLQYGEQEFSRRSERELAPYQTELDLMKDRWARESTGFSADSQAILDSLIAKLNAQTTLTVSERTQAIELAKLEEAKENAKSNIISLDLGNRIALVDSTTNQEINSFAKGKLASLGSSDDGF
jgi:hypothetical protein